MIRLTTWELDIKLVKSFKHFFAVGALNFILNLLE